MKCLEGPGWKQRGKSGGHHGNPSEVCPWLAPGVVVRWSKVVQSHIDFERTVDKFPYGLDVGWKRKAGVKND